MAEELGVPRIDSRFCGPSGSADGGRVALAPREKKGEPGARALQEEETMLIVITTLTLTLAKAMGVYMIAAGISGFIAPERWRLILDQLRADAAVSYISGAFSLILGAVLLLAGLFGRAG